MLTSNLLMGLAYFVFSLSLAAADGSRSPKRSSSTGKKVRISPRGDDKHHIKKFVDSCKKILPEKFYQENEPKITIDLLREILEQESKSQKENLQRISMIWKDHRYFYYSYELNKFSQIDETYLIRFVKHTTIEEPLKIDYWSYAVLKDEETKFYFWISHVLNSAFEKLSDEGLSQLKEMQELYQQGLYKYEEVFREKSKSFILKPLILKHHEDEKSELSEKSDSLFSNSEEVDVRQFIHESTEKIPSSPRSGSSPELPSIELTQKGSQLSPRRIFGKKSRSRSVPSQKKEPKKTKNQ